LNYNYPYGNTFYNPYQQQYQQQAQMPTLINKLYVTSEQDALSRFSSPNTITTFTLQDESGIIEVMTDAQGRKTTHKRLFVAEKKEEPSNPHPTAEFVTRAEFEDFRKKLAEIFPAKNEVKKDE
jgi:hypothetical protein